MGRPPLHPDSKSHQYSFKEHPQLIDKLDGIVADLAEDGIKASRADIMRALVMSHLDYAADTTKEWLGHEANHYK